MSLLLACSRTQVDAARAGQIRGLAASGVVAWNDLVERAERHNVLPLLCQNLNAICPDSVPSTVLADLNQRFMANAKSNLFLTGELCRILNSFDRAGLRSMPYKGPLLAESVYGNLALRRFCDLDILVRQEDVPAAWKELVSLGYEPQEELDSARESFCRRYAHHYGFVHPGKEVLVELHWTVVPRWFSAGFDMNAVWGRAGSAQLAGRDVLAPCPEDLLLMLCLHGAKEAWSSLGWICDLNELIQKQPFDWEYVFETARRSGCEALLCLGLLLAHNLLSAPLLEPVLKKAAANQSVRSIAEAVCEHLFTAKSWDEGIAAIARVNVETQRSAWSRFHCKIRMALVPGIFDIASIRLPRPLFSLYHLVRPVRLLCKYGLRIASRVDS